MRTFVLMIAILTTACVENVPCEIVQLEESPNRIPIQIAIDPTDSMARHIVDDSIELLNTTTTVAVASPDNIVPDVVVTIAGLSVLGTTDVRISYDMVMEDTTRLSIQLNEEVAEDRPTAVSIVVSAIARHTFGFDGVVATPECVGYMTESM